MSETSTIARPMEPTKNEPCRCGSGEAYPEDKWGIVADLKAEMGKTDAVPTAPPPTLWNLFRALAMTVRQWTRARCNVGSAL